MTARTDATTEPQIVTRKSTNWCGYLLTGPPGSFQSVSATWRVPQPLAGPSAEYYTLASIWVGLNGCSAESVCLTQAGCDLNAGKDPDGPMETEFDSWYELELSGDTGDVKLGSAYPVAALDELSCTITHEDGLRFTIAMADHTRGWTYQQEHSYPAGSPRPLMNSAEIIVEAPVWAGAGAIGKLTHFDTVTFRDARVNGRPLTDFADQATALTMVGDTSLPATGDNLLASPGPFADSFAVTWHNFGRRRAADRTP